MCTMTYQSYSMPNAFIWRRLHSISGLFLVLFLMEHLFVNSQAALLFGDNGQGFIDAVKAINSLPYLPVLEIFLIGFPFALHIFLGIRYLFTGKFNSMRSDGSQPALPEYSRNHAYTWQRITSWILLVGVIGHVVHMRFTHYPASAILGSEHSYFVNVSSDPGLYPLSERLGFTLWNPEEVTHQIQEFQKPLPAIETHNEGDVLLYQQHVKQREGWVKAVESLPVSEGNLMAVSKDFGTAELLMVRDTFKSPLMIALYTLFVLTSCFHAFNGLWTFMISWGVTLSVRSQQLMLKFSTGLMVLIAFLGLSAIWGTYWINLYT